MSGGGVASRAGRAVEKRTSTSSQTSPVRCHAVAKVTISTGAVAPLAGAATVESREVLGPPEGAGDAVRHLDRGRSRVAVASSCTSICAS